MSELHDTARSTPRDADPSVDRPLQVQILATEHWSLLATRTLTWNEMFARPRCSSPCSRRRWWRSRWSRRPRASPGSEAVRPPDPPDRRRPGVADLHPPRRGEHGRHPTRRRNEPAAPGYLDIAPELERTSRPRATTTWPRSWPATARSEAGAHQVPRGTPAFVGIVNVALTAPSRPSRPRTSPTVRSLPAPRCSAELRWRLCRWRWFDGGCGRAFHGAAAVPAPPGRRAWNEAAGAICEVGTTAASVDHRKRDCG